MPETKISKKGKVLIQASYCLLPLIYFKMTDGVWIGV